MNKIANAKVQIKKQGFYCFFIITSLFIPIRTFIKQTYLLPFGSTCLEYGLKPDIVGLSVYRWINPTAKDNFIKL